ncbi:MAG: signal peptidase II [bacterium]|nr:signal peptidase II [bacterium]
MRREYLNRLVWPSLIILIFFIVDRLLKNLFLEKLASERFYFFGEWIGFALQKNEGISYSIPMTNWLIVPITFIIILVLIFITIRIVKKNEWNYLSPLLLIIVGAFSNFIDRLIHGFVIDMVMIGKWLTFNIADVMIIVGAIWLILVYFKKHNLTKQKNIDSLN